MRRRHHLSVTWLYFLFNRFILAHDLRVRGNHRLRRTGTRKGSRTRLVPWMRKDTSAATRLFLIRKYRREPRKCKCSLKSKR